MTHQLYHFLPYRGHQRNLLYYRLQIHDFFFGDTGGLRESGFNIQLLHSTPCARPPASYPGRWRSARGRAGWSTLGTLP